LIILVGTADDFEVSVENVDLQQVGFQFFSQRPIWLQTGAGAQPLWVLGRLLLLGEFITMDNEDIDIATRSFYVQSNYDLSDYVKNGLHWNLFFETYDSELLDIDLEEGLDYRFVGTYFQTSTGFN
tara:strand:- start:171 stop:548 length:378 start_codon:yes stop_codon:yes gene_type:complete